MGRHEEEVVRAPKRTKDWECMDSVLIWGLNDIFVTQCWRHNVPYSNRRLKIFTLEHPCGANEPFDRPDPLYLHGLNTLGP